MLDEIALLINPTAGRGRVTEVSRAAVGHLRESGIRVREITGRDPSEARELARRAVEDGVEALVACGGDGLVNIALQVIAEAPTPLGVIPAGTGNDFARALGIPRDPVDAARLVCRGSIRTIDAGRVDDRWFGTVLAGGFDAKVNDRTNRMSWPRGNLRYNLAILAELAALRPLDYVIELDGHRLRTEATLVAVGNSRSYGGGMRICPSAKLDDGLLDVTVIGPTRAARFVRLMPTVYSGTHVDRSGVSTFRARRVGLSTPELTAYADGERFAAMPLTCECVPAAVRVIAPPL